MLDFLSDLNGWIKDHLELLTVVGIPVLTLLVTKLSNSSSERRASAERKVERELSREIKLADFRQQWIIDLRNEFAEYLVFIQNLSLLSEDSAKRLSLSQQRIFLMMNKTDSNFVELVEKLDRHFDASVPPVDEELRRTMRFEIGDTMNTILKSEWERLKNDLRASETPKAP